MNIDSVEEFEAWYHDRHRGGGHPWEVCRGGNSTHIDLYVRHNENGFFLSVRGKAWTRSIEAIKFYNALRAEGVAVYLHDAKGKTIGMRIRECRVKMGMTQDELATMMCTKKPTISSYELGKNDVKVGILEEMALLLGTTMSYLAGGESCDFSPEVMQIAMLLEGMQNCVEWLWSR